MRDFARRVDIILGYVTGRVTATYRSNDIAHKFKIDAVQLQGKRKKIGFQFTFNKIVCSILTVKRHLPAILCTIHLRISTPGRNKLIIEIY